MWPDTFSNGSKNALTALFIIWRREDLQFGFDGFTTSWTHQWYPRSENCSDGIIKAFWTWAWTTPERNRTPTTKVSSQRFILCSSPHLSTVGDSWPSRLHLSPDETSAALFIIWREDFPIPFWWFTPTWLGSSVVSTFWHVFVVARWWVFPQAWALLITEQWGWTEKEAHSNGKKDMTIGEFLLSENLRKGDINSRQNYFSSLVPLTVARLQSKTTIGKGLVLHDNSFFGSRRNQLEDSEITAVTKESPSTNQKSEGPISCIMFLPSLTILTGTTIGKGSWLGARAGLTKILHGRKTYFAILVLSSSKTITGTTMGQRLRVMWTSWLENLSKEDPQQDTQWP